jgi:hypothetical protein
MNTSGGVKYPGLVFNKACAKEVQVNVTYQLLPVGVFLAEYRFIAVLEKLAMSAIFAVEAHGIAR